MTDLQELGAIQAIPHTLAHNLCWVHQVTQNCLVHLRNKKTTLEACRA